MVELVNRNFGHRGLDNIPENLKTSKNTTEDKEENTIASESKTYPDDNDVSHQLTAMLKEFELIVDEKNRTVSHLL